MLPRQRRITIGQMCKQLIDQGRLSWLQMNGYQVGKPAWALHRACMTTMHMSPLAAYREQTATDLYASVPESVQVVMVIFLKGVVSSFIGPSSSHLLLCWVFSHPCHENSFLV